MIRSGFLSTHGEAEHCVVLRGEAEHCVVLRGEAVKGSTAVELSCRKEEFNHFAISDIFLMH